MPRQPRYFLPNVPQHVIQRGVDRQATFFEDEDYQLYRRVLLHGATKNDCRIHAYVLMTNHTHLLVTPRNATSIPRLMQAIGRSYVQALNKKYGRTGTLWEGRYRASLVQEDQYLLACYRYIELNPVRAGIVKNPAEYPYSSYACNANGKFDLVLTPHSNYLSLARTAAKRQIAYRKLFAVGTRSHDLEEIREATNSCLVLGDENFKDQIEALLGRTVRPRKAGRRSRLALIRNSTGS